MKKKQVVILNTSDGAAKVATVTGTVREKNSYCSPAAQSTRRFP